MSDALRDARDPRGPGARRRRPARWSPPISLATTFAQDAVGKHRGYEYARSGNPTRTALETCVASLENARHGLAFASGLAAEDAILRTLDPGDHVIIPTDAYGGTFRLVARVHERHGIAWTAVDLRDLAALEAAWRDETRLVWIESPTNPALSIVDIEAVAEFAHARDARVVVDNTFATPFLQQPLALGADVSVHSSTKYLGGHSDVVGGFVAVDDAELADEVRFLQNAMGAVPSPFDCYLVLRGVKTLAVRMERHCANARAIVQMLREHDAVARVLYPGLADHPGHDVARRQMRDFGGMVSFLAARRRGRRARGRGAHAAVHAGRVARRGRVADRAPGAHDPRVGRGLAARGRSARSCGCRSASRRATTSSPTSPRPSTPSSEPGAARPATPGPDAGGRSAVARQSDRAHGSVPGHG